jgi:hypothetical protein
MQIYRVQQFIQKWQRFALVAVICGVVFGATLPAADTYAASATYSCGTYGAGNYSTSNCTSAAVSAPNTGFAKLLEPTNIMAIIASLALLGIGIGIIVKARRKSRV